MKLKYLVGLGVYSMTSYYFLNHPELLHHRKKKLELMPLPEG